METDRDVDLAEAGDVPDRALYGHVRRVYRLECLPGELEEELRVLHVAVLVVAEARAPIASVGRGRCRVLEVNLAARFSRVPGLRGPGDGGEGPGLLLGLALHGHGVFAVAVERGLEVRRVPGDRGVVHVFLEREAEAAPGRLGRSDVEIAPGYAGAVRGDPGRDIYVPVFFDGPDVVPDVAEREGRRALVAGRVGTDLPERTAQDRLEGVSGGLLHEVAAGVHFVSELRYADMLGGDLLIMVRLVGLGLYDLEYLENPEAVLVADPHARGDDLVRIVGE